MDRRQFLKIIGAGGAAAAAEGCAPAGPAGRNQIIPYFIPIENVTPGVSVEYSTVCRECPAGCGMVAKVRDGRAHKLEGNPGHPLNRGTLCLRGQSALQDLYHPDRIRQPLARDAFGRLQPISWDEAEERLSTALATLGERQTAWIGRLETGAFDRLVDAWLAAVAPSHVRLRYEPFAYEALRTANSRVFGSAEVPDVRIFEARMLLSFGADFLETWVSNVEYSRDFSAWRQARLAGQHQGRYVFIGPRLSLTGANADEWLPVRPGTEGLVAEALTAIVRGQSIGVSALAETAGVSVSVLERIGREFAAATPSLALPLGQGGGETAVAANEAILRLNEAAGNVDRTYLLGRPHALSSVSRYAEGLELVQAMRAGSIGVLCVHEANPAYHLSPSVGFAEALERVPVIVSFSSFEDETTARATLVLPDHRPLESWGEYSPRPGVTGLLQPVVLPVFDTRQTGDVLLSTARRLARDLGAPDFRSYLQQSLGLSEPDWAAAVQRGGIFPEPADAPGRLDAGMREEAVAGVPESAEPRGVRPSLPSAATAPPPESEASFEPEPAPRPVGRTERGNELLLHLYPSLHFFDGRTANRSWTQEIPDPMTKAVWGSWAELHPDTAARLGVGDDDVLAVARGAAQIQVPALMTDRIHPDVVAIQLGQGHTHYGRYAAGVGVNPMRLLPGTADATAGPPGLSGLPVTVTRLPMRRNVVVLQTSERLVSENVARRISLTEARRMAGEPGEFAFRDVEQPSLYQYVPQGAHHWGMVIDLDRCIGCNACAAACYAENNVPVVGRDECIRGREMAWLRIENYVGEPAAVPATASRPIDLRFLPMLCQQCNNAPCEYVCPVYASIHSDEGLNQQVYNRCVGTRFCSNNCPYKVRRFNWFAYEFPAPLDQQLNPDVIQRPVGVMEKCTFCIQRIRRSTIDAGTEGRSLRDGEIMTACQQTCPTDAIVFGDLRDPNSRVSRLARSPRGYGALSELNTYPNITYLARVAAEPEG